MNRYLLCFCLLMICRTPLFGEGYAVNLQSTRQVGMGNIGTGLVFGATSIYYNPGAMAQMQEGFSYFAGVSFIASETDFTSIAPAGFTADTDNPVGFPFFLYAAYKAENLPLAFGLGVYTPFGNSVEWGDWVGSPLVEEVELAEIFIQPTISAALFDGKLGIGIGLILAVGTVELQREVVLGPGTSGTLNLDGDAFDVGLNAGIRYQPVEEFAIGFTYKSEIQATVNEGDADFSIPGVLPDEFNAMLPLPASLNWGLAFYPNDKLLLGFDLNWIFWSEFETLDIELPGAPADTAGANIRNWRNSFTYRFGGQYIFNHHFIGRAGFYYDQTPTNANFYSPETPGSNRWGFSIGGTFFPTDRLGMDFALLYVNGRERTGTSQYPSGGELVGDYKSTAWIPSIGISYNMNRIKK